MTITYHGSAAESALGADPFTAIEIQPLSDSQWRVCDRRLPDNDVRSLLGYVEHGNLGFDVLTLENGFQRLSFATMREVRSYFERTYAAHGWAEA